MRDVKRLCRSPQPDFAVSLQISMFYNIPPPADFSAFNVSANTMAKCNISRPQLILFVHVRYSACVSWV